MNYTPPRVGLSYCFHFGEYSRLTSLTVDPRLISTWVTSVSTRWDGLVVLLEDLFHVFIGRYRLFSVANNARRPDSAGSVGVRWCPSREISSQTHYIFFSCHFGLQIESFRQQHIRCCRFAPSTYSESRAVFPRRYYCKYWHDESRRGRELRRHGQ